METSGLHEAFLAESVEDIRAIDDIIIKDACRLESDIYCLLLLYLFVIGYALRL